MSITNVTLTTSPANVYVSNGNTAITFMSFCNFSAGNVVANVYVVPGGGSAGNSTIILTGIELSASGANTGDTYQIYSGGEKLLLGNGDTVQADATANSAITVVTSYTTI